MTIKNIVLGIVIIILTISVVVYGVNMVYSNPDYDDFCGEKSLGPVTSEADCLAVGGKWSGYEGEVKPVAGDAVTGWCDVDYQCREEYEAASETYYKNLFLITLPLGIIIIALGALIFGLEAVGAGLMGGGVGVILWGIGGYWRYSADLMKFLLSLVGLLIVIWLAYKINQGSWKFWKKRKK